MRLLVASHKLCWVDASAPAAYATDGGFASQIGALATLFDETVLCVPVAPEPAGEGLTAIDRHLVVHPLVAADGPLWRRRLRSLSWFGALWREVREVDAVHAPVPGDVGFLAVIVSLLARKKLFVRHCATWSAPRTRSDRALRTLLERVAGGRVVVLATGAGAGPPAPGHDDIHWVFSSSVRAEELDPERQSSRHAPLPGSAQLVTGGRLIVDKGADTVIEAFAELRRRGLAAHLHVVGDGPARGVLERRVAALAITAAVTFHGRLPRDAVLGVFDQADLFVYPTRSSEGFPKLVLEALSRGLPTVATPVSAIPSMIDGAGLVVAADVDAVIEGAASILGDPARYGEFCRQAVQNASRYTLEAWVDEIGDRLTAAWGPLSEPTLAEAAR